MGSTLLRSPGSSNPAQYIFNGIARSACPAACARPFIYAAKRFSCGPGVECLPTKQFYTNLFCSQHSNTRNSTTILLTVQEADSSWLCAVTGNDTHQVPSPVDRETQGLAPFARMGW